MSTLTYGSLFSGYGGLDMGIQSVLGGHTLWHSDIDPGACKILAHRYPDVTNLGDVTAIDWTTVPRVDVLTGGFPCQDISTAGRRAGLIRDGDNRTRSGLWGHMRTAIDHLRPALVVAENVRGILSARADSDVEPCPWCMGDADDQPHVRALGAVLADLADLGYDAQWYGLRAADVGAPHGRFRIFIFAWPAADTHSHLLGQHGGEPSGEKAWAHQGHGSADSDRGSGAGLTLLPTPRVTQAGYADDGRGGKSLDVEARRLLPTPGANLGDNGGPQHPDKRRAGGHSVSLDDVATHLLPTPKTTDSRHSSPADLRRNEPGLRAIGGLLPTPRATDGTKGGPNQRGSPGDLMLPSAVHQWGDYGPAVARWERIFGRPAPEPTIPGARGGRRLNPELPEWMMGLPHGWITATPGITRNESLRAAGNGVVPQQAAAAVRALLADLTLERAV